MRILAMMMAAAHSEMTGRCVRKNLTSSSMPTDMKKMLEQAEKSGNYTYGCIDSIDQASEEDRRMFGEWISARMGLKENVWANHVAANGR